MPKVVGVHTLALKPGVSGADFEQFMQEQVFTTGIGMVINLDKKISHGFTLADWAGANHLLLRNSQDDRKENYSWMILADVPDEHVSTAEGRLAVQNEALNIAEEFFSRGLTTDPSAAVKIKPFASRTSFAAFLEVGRSPL